MDWVAGAHGRGLRQSSTCSKDANCQATDQCSLDSKLCSCKPGFCRCQSSKQRTCVPDIGAATTCPKGLAGPVCSGTASPKQQCQPFMRCSPSGTKCECLPGYAACGGSPALGCPISLQSDLKNCGACARKCPPNTLCQQGKCVCTPGWADCSGDLVKVNSGSALTGVLLNGCETFVWGGDAGNCNACGKSFVDANGDLGQPGGNGCESNPTANACLSVFCGANAVCCNGTCSCKTGFADQNHDLGVAGGNGCETNLTAQTFAGSTHADCGQNAFCSAGSSYCMTGFNDTNGDLGQPGGNGCEVSTSQSLSCSSAADCGPNASCTGSSCHCLAGFNDTNGDLGQPGGDGCEVSTSPVLGGSLVCGPNTNCTQPNSCVCLIGFGDANADVGVPGGDGCEQVLAISTPPPCNTTAGCGPNAYCCAGSCHCVPGYTDGNGDLGFQAATGFGDVNNDMGMPGGDGCEVNLTAPQPCATSAQCGPNAACAAGACYCLPFYSDTNGDLGQLISNGCETFVYADPCASLQCGPNAGCSSGNCTCLPGYLDVNNNLGAAGGDGCEVALSSGRLAGDQILFCGGRDASCEAALQECLGGVCTCKEGFSSCSIDGGKTSTCIPRGQCCDSSDCHPSQQCMSPNGPGGLAGNLHDCNASPLDGCETVGLNTSASCGACGATCQLGQSCLLSAAGAPWSCVADTKAFYAATLTKGPWVNERVDACRGSKLGVEQCGLLNAALFCKTQGFASAADFALAAVHDALSPDPSVTAPSDPGSTCGQRTNGAQPCFAFSYVVCSQAALPPAELADLDSQGTLYGKLNPVPLSSAKTFSTPSAWAASPSTPARTTGRRQHPQRVQPGRRTRLLHHTLPRWAGLRWSRPGRSPPVCVCDGVHVPAGRWQGDPLPL
ncbi:hypothetical protein ABPG75_010214 [Micractinium tetrahymenae]